LASLTNDNQVVKIANCFHQANLEMPYFTLKEKVSDASFLEQE
jgi:hypothetical protein